MLHRIYSLAGTHADRSTHGKVRAQATLDAAKAATFRKCAEGFLKGHRAGRRFGFALAVDAPPPGFVLYQVLYRGFYPSDIFGWWRMTASSGAGGEGGIRTLGTQ